MDELLRLLGLIFAGDDSDEIRTDAFDEMDGDTLAETAAALRAAAEEVASGDVNSDDVAQLARAARAMEAIRVETEQRSTEADQLAAERDAALAAIRGETDPDGGDADGDGDADDTGDGEGDDAGEQGDADDAGDDAGAEDAADEGTPAPEAVAAAAPPARTRPRTAVRVPASHTPRVSATDGQIEGLVASGDVPGMGAGMPFRSLDQLGEALIDKAEGIRASVPVGNGEKFYVAHHRRDYPASRQLSGNLSGTEVMARIEQITSHEAIVAAGGTCAPAEVRYQLTTWGQTNRPVREALPGFQATRGGISIIPSPVLGDIVVDDTGGAIDTVTNQQDIDETETKTVQTITCADPTDVFVRARTLAFKGGNFSDRFNPERMRAFVALGEVAFARDGDKKLLQDIRSGSTLYTNTPAEFGAYRDLKRQLLGVLAELEDVLRDRTVRYRVILPDYVPKMLVTDLVAQQPGDRAHEITEEAMRRDIASWAPNLNVTYALDSRATNGRLLATPTQNPPGAPRTASFDADVEWAIFPEGAWIYLDGGSLDLGVVRDSTLNAANRFQTFYEEWEAVAHVAGPSLWVTSSLCAGGDTQVATDIAACSPQGS